MLGQRIISTIAVLFFLFMLMMTSKWFVTNIYEAYVESFCLGGGIFVVVAIGLIVALVFEVRDWKRGRRH